LALNECGVRRILHKDLHYHPYKIQVDQELSARNNSSGLRFRADSFLVSAALPGPPDRLTLQYQTTSLGPNVKSSFHETRSANIHDLKHQLECIQSIAKEMLQRDMTAFLSRLQVY
jgi:hypothetical protein